MSQYENLSPEALSSLVDASRAINAHQTTGGDARGDRGVRRR